MPRCVITDSRFVLPLHVYCSVPEEVRHGDITTAIKCVWNVITALQKQVGCFNHRVVALVADKLERQWLLEVCFDVED